MLSARTWPAPRHLARHVTRVWRVRGRGGAEDWLLPDVGGADVAIHLGEPGRVGGSAPPLRVVAGSLRRAVPMTHGRWVDTVGIQLAPGCACLVGVPAAALRDRILPVADVAPRLDADLARWAEAGAAMDALFGILAAHLAPRCDEVAARAARALAEGAVPVSRLADALCLSRRQLTRRFETQVGLSPRQFVRVARFARAWRIASAGPPASWADVAAAAGYADQPHLNRDFRLLVGLSPPRVFTPGWYAGVEVSPPFKTEPPPAP